MSKLVFASVGIPNRGFVSQVRSYFQYIASYVEKSPDAKTDVRNQIAALNGSLGIAGLVTGQTLTGVTPTGTYATTVTFTVSAAGVITAIALS